MIKSRYCFSVYCESTVRANESARHPSILRVNGQLCRLSDCRLYSRKGRPDSLIVVSFNRPDRALEQYKERWEIGMRLKVFKSSGFDIERTHLQDMHRIQKLVPLFMEAFVWYYKVGICLHQIGRIGVKKDRRMAKSIFKYGPDHIASALLNLVNRNNYEPHPILVMCLDKKVKNMYVC